MKITEEKPDAEKFHAEVENILTYMALARQPARIRGCHDKIDLQDFDGALPTGDTYLKSIGVTVEREEVDGAEGEDLLERWCSPSELATPVNFAFVTDRGANKAPYNQGEAFAKHGIVYGLSRVRQISVQDARGRLTRQCPVNVRVTRATVNREGAIAAAVHHYVGFAAGAWHTASVSGHPFNKVIVADAIDAAKRAIAFQRLMEREWRVLLGWEGMPRVTFVTDPEGAREVFRLRDVPNGKARRAALRNWVTGHWRTALGSGRTEVRRHLRGALDFTWNGLRCKIIPSLQDRMANGESVELTAPAELEAGRGEL